MTDIKKILAERDSTYGKFENHASISQMLKLVLKSEEQWYFLAPDQREALEMIMHKVARIINGNPNYIDSWVDITGYSQLVADRLSSEAECTKN